MDITHRLAKIADAFAHARPLQFWTSVAALLFAAIFLGVGLTRTVEFNGLGLSRMRRRVLSLFHIVGSIVLTLALVGLAVDFNQEYQTFVRACFLCALVLLFPIHIYIGLLRRVELRRRMDTN